MKNTCLILLLLLASCGAHTNIEPAGKGKINLNASLGGPFVRAFDASIPMPYLMAAAEYGISSNIDVNANIHILPLFYKLAGMDLGVTYYPVLNHGVIPTIAINLRGLFYSSLKNEIEDRFRFYPMTSLTAAWQAYNGKVYLGSEFVVPFSDLDYQEDNPYPVISPLLGYKLELGEKNALYAEAKWQGVNISSDKLAVEYIHPGGNGAIGIFFSFERKLR
jgi:hypothetical protein